MKKKKKKSNLAMALTTGGEPVVIGTKFTDWLIRREWYIESSDRVFRVDSEKIPKFEPQNYYFNKDGSGSVDDTKKPPEWAKGTEGKFRSGLFAGNYNQIISYMIPRHIPWLMQHTSPKPTLYYNNQNRQEMMDYKPWITSFEANKFELLSKDGQGEYFAEKPPQPVKQVQIKNPMRVLENKFILVPLENLEALKNKYQEFKDKNISADAEALE